MLALLIPFMVTAMTAVRALPWNEIHRFHPVPQFAKQTTHEKTMRTHGVPPLLTVLLVALFAPSLPANADDPQDFAAQDNRVAIPVSPRERNVMLYEMRELLHGMVNLHGALAKNDPAATALHARTMAPLMDKTPASLKERLPEEFTQLSIAQRESFEAIANASLARKDASRVQHQLAETMTYCSGCHDAFRFEVRKTGSRK